MKMIILTQVIFDSHKNVFSIKVPFTRKPGESFKIVLDPNKIASMKEGTHRDYRPANGDFPVITTLTMFNKRRIHVAESISFIKKLTKKKLLIKNPKEDILSLG